MSRFNSTSPGTKVKNIAGGDAYSQSPELELVSILLTSFANDAFYKKANATFERLIELVQKCDPEFVAKAAVYARTEFGMRSITHVVASELAKRASGKEWAAKFYESIVYRPDDMMEILSYHSKNGKVTNAMKNGFAKAFDKFDKYKLAKYRGQTKEWKLVDVVNMVHPVPTEKNAEAINALIKGELKSFDTWESELSKAGQETEEGDNFRTDVWTKLIQEKKLGYFALLRNIRNIVEHAPEVLDEALTQLTNESAIKKSLVLPFRFMTAYEELNKINGPVMRKALTAVNKALDIAVQNVPQFEGETLVVLDVSSSMRGTDEKSPAKIGSVFSAALVKRNDCDFMMFDGDARYVNTNTSDSLITIISSMRFDGGSTNFHSVFQRANRKYDRIIILSDMQGWVGYHSPVSAFNDYKKKTGANPFIYSFDLKNYGSMQFPESQVFCLAGFSEKVFDIMKLLEVDKKALVNTIKSVAWK